MSTPGEDRDLEEFLSGQSDLSRRYRSSRPEGASGEPPADVDHAILAQARAAVAAPKAAATPRPVRKRLQWAVPFALAASVLLTFAIYREGSQKVGVTGELDTAVVTEQAAAPLSAPVEVGTVAEAVQADRADAVAVTRDEVAQKAVEARAAAPVVATPPEAAVTTVESAATANLTVTSIPSPPSPLPPLPPPAAPAPSVAMAPSVPAAQRASAETARAESEAAQAERTPEAWLEEVRTLRAAGQGAAADEELKRFLEAYPDYFTRNPGVARP